LGLRVHKERRVVKDFRVHQVQPVLWGLKELLEPKDFKELKEPLEQLVHKVLLEHKDFKVLKEF
jgi:hypothetical protein